MLERRYILITKLRDTEKSRTLSRTQLEGILRMAAPRKLTEILSILDQDGRHTLVSDNRASGMEVTIIALSDA